MTNLNDVVIMILMIFICLYSMWLGYIIGKGEYKMKLKDKSKRMREKNYKQYKRKRGELIKKQERAISRGENKRFISEEYERRLKREKKWQ